MGGSKRAPNKVIWNMADIQDQVDLARDLCHELQDEAERLVNPKLLMLATQIERHLNQIERHALDARHNRYKDNAANGGSA